MVRLPGVAPGLPPWRGDILLLNHNRESKRAGSVPELPAHAISTKNKHLLAIYSIPTRGFTAAVSVFRGTPPAKPLICKFKIRLARPDDAVFRSWAHHTGEASLLVLAKFNLSPEDIIKMSLCSCSQIVRLSSFLVHFMLFRENKKPCLHFGKQGGKSLFRFVTCLRPSLSKLPSGCCPIGAGDSPRLNTQPWVIPAMTCRFRDRIVGQLVADMFKQVFIELEDG